MIKEDIDMRLVHIRVPIMSKTSNKGANGESASPQTFLDGSCICHDWNSMQPQNWKMCCSKLQGILKLTLEICTVCTVVKIARQTKRRRQTWPDFCHLRHPQRKCKSTIWQKSKNGLQNFLELLFNAKTTSHHNISPRTNFLHQITSSSLYCKF